MRGDHKTYEVPKHQTDAVLSQANPVSGIKYTVLDTTKNVRIIGFSAKVTWAVTQPTPLEVHITIDGQTITYSVTDPVSATDYFPTAIQPQKVPTAYTLSTVDLFLLYRAFLLEGRSIKIEVEITWATTQPTPLVCRVVYAKW